jgi:hypothetical protein
VVGLAAADLDQVRWQHDGIEAVWARRHQDGERQQEGQAHRIGRGSRLEPEFRRRARFLGEPDRPVLDPAKRLSMAIMRYLTPSHR